jgi:hypothetical protein
LARPGWEKQGRAGLGAARRGKGKQGARGRPLARVRPPRRALESGSRAPHFPMKSRHRVAPSSTAGREHRRELEKKLATTASSGEHIVCHQGRQVPSEPRRGAARHPGHGPDHAVPAVKAAAAQRRLPFAAITRSGRTSLRILLQSGLASRASSTADRQARRAKPRARRSRRVGSSPTASRPWRRAPSPRWTPASRPKRQGSGRRVLPARSKPAWSGSLGPGTWRGLGSRAGEEAGTQGGTEHGAQQSKSTPPRRPCSRRRSRAP